MEIFLFFKVAIAIVYDIPDGDKVNIFYNPCCIFRITYIFEKPDFYISDNDIMIMHRNISRFITRTIFKSLTLLKVHMLW